MSVRITCARCGATIKVGNFDGLRWSFAPDAGWTCPAHVAEAVLVEADETWLDDAP